MPQDLDPDQAVLTGRADFAIVTDVVPDVYRLRLYPLKRGVLMRRNHPMTRLRRALTAEDLAHWDRVSIQTGRISSWVGPDQELFSSERHMEHAKFSTSRFNLAWEAMEKTDLIAVCGFRTAEIAMRQSALTFMPLEKRPDEPQVWNALIWSEVVHNDGACIWFRGLWARWARQEAERMDQIRKTVGLPPVT